MIRDFLPSVGKALDLMDALRISPQEVSNSCSLHYNTVLQCARGNENTKVKTYRKFCEGVDVVAEQRRKKQEMINKGQR